jgi:predicted NUDIX family phosphoesterase
MPADEHVLGVPAARLDAVGGFVGFRPADAEFAAKLLDPAAFAFRPRSEVETDPTFLQLIPYVVLRHGGRVFSYRRGAAGTEARLRARRSIGVGGHISREDAAGGADPYRAGMLRELREEVAVGNFTEAVAGFVFDPTTPVGAVHLGVVHLLELAEPAVTPREDAIIGEGFAAVGELLAAADEFESWSRLVLGWLAG